MLFVRRPYVLEEADAVRWMREQGAPLAAVPAVDRVEMTRLQAPALRGGPDWEWLLEMHCQRGEDAERAARDAACPLPERRTHAARPARTPVRL